MISWTYIFFKIIMSVAGYLLRNSIEKKRIDWF
jgi:hypothetical protein